MIKLLELFGGIGAPRVALRNIGVPTKSIDYVEIDQKAVNSYNAMFSEGNKYKTQDVAKWNLKPDILVHGSPCQDFSVLGEKRGGVEGSGTRSSLMWETVHIVEQMGEWKPTVVIWENVKGVLQKKMHATFSKYLESMENMGYTNSYEVLNAIDFGLPQKRERVFTVSLLNGKTFNFNNLTRQQMKPIENYLEKDVPSYYTVKQPSILKAINRKAGNIKFNVNVIDKYAYTITTKQMRSPNSGVVELNDGTYRYLTERECWRLMGFSDEDYDAALAVNPSKKGFMNTALYKQAGNSMPVPVLEAIFKELKLDEINTQY